MERVFDRDRKLGLAEGFEHVVEGAELEGLLDDGDVVRAAHHHERCVRCERGYLLRELEAGGGAEVEVA
jgi:hypothetical protein